METPGDNWIDFRHPELWDEPDYIRKEIACTMSHIYRHGMTTTSGGNLSVTDSLGNIWITPSGTDKGSMMPDDVVCVAPDGTVGGLHKPSMEYPMHRAVFDARPDIRVLVHAHPPVLTSFSIIHRIPDTSVVNEWRELCGQVGYAAFAIPGSKAMGEIVASEFSKGHDVVIMENHAVVVGGRNMAEALARLETLEYCASAIYAAGFLGENFMSVYAGDEYYGRADGGLAQSSGRVSVPASGGCIQPSGRVSLPASDGSIQPSGRGFLASSGGSTQPPRPESLSVSSGNEMSPDELLLAEEICHIAGRACERGLMYGFSGTLSARRPAGGCLITPENVLRCSLGKDDIVTCSGGGEGRFKEERLHSETYRRFPAVKAVITARPSYLMAFAVTGKEPDVRTIPESWLLLRELPAVTCGEPEPDNECVFARLAAGLPAVLICNDSVLVTGESLLQAFDRLEVAEMTARSLILGEPLGSVKPISAQNIKNMQREFGIAD